MVTMMATDQDNAAANRNSVTEQHVAVTPVDRPRTHQDNHAGHPQSGRQPTSQWNLLAKKYQ